MCANYQPAPHDKLLSHFGISFEQLKFFEECYPGSFAPIIRGTQSSDLMADDMECLPACFGLVPFWNNKPHAYRKTYNARSETVNTKPSYVSAWRKRQFCIIPSASFYEPNYETGKAVRWRIAHRTGRPIGIAGIWEHRLDKDGKDWYSFSMITVNADDHILMKRFHKPGEEKRMVVILEPSQYHDWLYTSLDKAPNFFQQCPAEQLVAEPAPIPPRKKKIKDAA